MYLGENIKKLGFGLMRLPQQDEAIDIEQVKLMVDKFLAAGFTYFDTAWAYAAKWLGRTSQNNVLPTTGLVPKYERRTVPRHQPSP